MFDYVDNSTGFFALLSKLEKSRWIAIDTEFVSERRFHPQLCLIQLAYEGGVCLIDPLEYRRVEPFWDLLVNGDHETIVHAGRGDLEFCIRQTGQLPKRIFDTQLAAGFIGLEYPAGCGNLISKVLDVDLPNTETRTDWSRRPLNNSQLEYGADDVRYLQPMRNRIGGKLEKLGRTAWYVEEIDSWKEKVLWQFGSDRWEKLIPNSSMDRKSLAIIRELFFWREKRAEKIDCPVKRVLRDDLIIELAKRHAFDLEKIREIRDFAQSNYAGILDALVKVVSHAAALPLAQCPEVMSHDPSCKMLVLGQLLNSALGTICKQSFLAPALVANPTDVRQWALWRLRPDLEISLPKLEQGWRQGIVGQVFEQLINGDIVIRVSDPLNEQPLEFLKKV